MWPISLPHGISKKTLRMFATSRRILSNIEELLGGMRASFSRTKIYGGGTNNRDTSVKVIRHYSGISSAHIYPFPPCFFSLPLDWKIASPAVFFHPFSIPAFLINQQTSINKLTRECTYSVTYAVPSFGEIQRKLESFARTTPDAGYHFAKQGNSSRIGFLNSSQWLAPWSNCWNVASGRAGFLNFRSTSREHDPPQRCWTY